MQVTGSRHFEPWLAQEKLSLAVSTYTAGKLMLIGRKSSGGLGLFERTFSRCMGLWSNGQTLYAATAYQIWRFENVLEEGVLEGDFDRLFVPRTGHTTGDIDVHDIALGNDGLRFITTLFSSMGALSDRASFRSVWQPSFISKLAAEDRCHLNGLAMVNGEPAYATAVADSDAAAAWRDHRQDGGVVLDIAKDRVIARDLSMPHSPRWHNGKLWLLDSGNGYLGYIDNGEFQRVAFLPGYGRGLCFGGDFAIVGVSRPRGEPTFAGLPLEDELRKRKAKPKCGVMVVRLSTGDIEHWLEFGEGINELYDVVTLPNVRRPKALGFKTDEIRYTVNIENNPTIWKGQPNS
jgi:uncharacterized protein (TIGR03032 family)